MYNTKPHSILQIISFSSAVVYHISSNIALRNYSVVAERLPLERVNFDIGDIFNICDIKYKAQLITIKCKINNKFAFNIKILQILQKMQNELLQINKK